MTLMYYKNTVYFKLPFMIDELDAEIQIRTFKHKKFYSTFYPTKIKYIIKVLLGCMHTRKTSKFVLVELKNGKLKLGKYD